LFRVPTPVKRFCAGSLAGVTATCCTYPLDLAKARLSTTAASQYPSLWSVFVNVYRAGGLFGLYRGIFPTVLGSVPYAGTSFFTYETLKLLNRDRTGRTENVFEKLGFGAIAGLCGQSASYPLDILRRRMQTGVIVRGTSMLQVYRTILKTEGVVHGLYKGLSMNWIKGPVAVGVSFTVYETLVRMFRQVPYISKRISS
uniref:Mitochondrial coenzyme A transporter SLC25A42 n=1 Tax=Soboliphyme baturini TaxID=241478 RepID=A0A183IFW3_9BILA